LELDIETEITKAKEYYSQLAFDCLEKLPVQDSKKTELRNLAEYLLGREK
jgi:hypothetical protein